MQSDLLHNDPDLLLARKIGSLLEQGLPLGDELRGSELWLDTLLDIREDVVPETGRIPLQGESDGNDTLKAHQEWEAIEAIIRSKKAGSDTQGENEPLVGIPAVSGGAGNGTGQSSSTPLPLIHTLHTYRAWIAAAAVMLVAMLTGIYLYTSSVTPVYVAESGASQTVYTAPDGSVITLRPWSKLRELDTRPDLLAYAIEGQAFFEVTRDAGRTFRVETGGGTVTVLGTSFTAGNIGGKSRVYLRSGSVEFTSPTSGESVILEPGYTATIDTEGNLSEPAAIRDEEAMGWLFNQLNFSGRAATEVIAELEHHFRLRITLPASIGDETISGRILLDDPDRALGDAAIALGGHFTRSGENHYVFNPN
jgi:transmembrane sensor